MGERSEQISVEEDGKQVLYKESDWFVKKGWMNEEGKVILREIAEYIDAGWNDRAALLKKELFNDKPKLKNRIMASVMSFDFENDEVTTADNYSKQGGDTIEPRMFTTSFPGRERGVLFGVLAKMHLRSGKGGDYHAMNDNKKETYGNMTPYPEEWLELFGKTKEWKNMKKFLRSTDKKIFKKSRSSSDKEGPEWFTDHWGPSALYAAKHAATRGSGVLIFKSWWGYNKSPWCKLEFLFCKCLSQKYPKSVYVITGFNVTTAKQNGYFMKGNETF